MATNPKHLNKLAPTAPKPLTEDEKAQQIARFLAQKREQFFQLILANSLQNVQLIPADISQFVDTAIAGADYALEKLYPVKQEEAK